jgi:hypothetical protein
MMRTSVRAEVAGLTPFEIGQEHWGIALSLDIHSMDVAKALNHLHDIQYAHMIAA